ncbi:MAG: hypothetical protein IPJ34_40255 [Myxococcales bacterium]|nr:hypothetical protein [Myxococcales bacterium]
MSSLGPLVRGFHVVALALVLGTTVSVGCRKPQVVEDAAVAAPSCSNTVSDSANCGACGQACIAGPCQSSTCRVRLLTWLRRSDDYAFAADDRHVYYVAAYAGSVARVPLAGGPREILAAKASETAFQARPSIALSKDAVFWVWNGNHVHSVKKEGGVATELFVDERRSVRMLQTLDDELWWGAMADPEVEGKAKSSLHRASLGKEVPVGPSLEWLSFPPLGDATSAFYFEGLSSTGRLVEVDHKTKKKVVLAQLDEKARILHFDAKSVYVSEKGAIKQVARHTPGPVRTLYAPTAPEYVTGALFDAQYVWISLPHSALRVSLADGSVTPLTTTWAPLTGYLEVADPTGLVLLLVVGEGKRAKHVLVRIDK